MANIKTALIEPLENYKTSENFKTQPYSGKANDTEALEAHIKKLEAEQELINNPVIDEPTEEDKLNATEPQTVEEMTFKKRYGDLRRHSQKQEAEFKARLEALEGTEDSHSELPTTAEELAEFKEKYPDVFKMVKGVVLEENTPVQAEIDKLTLAKAEADEAIAKKNLYKLHPDLDEVNNSTEFKNWYDTKPSRQKEFIAEVLFESDDVDSAAALITQFKDETGYGKKKRGRPTKGTSAAESVKASTTPEPAQTSEERVWTESEIASMTPTNELMEIWTKAQQEGRVQNDLNNTGHIQ